MSRRLTIETKGPIFLLKSDEGYWVGPGLGCFKSSKDARNWAKANGYSIARAIRRN